MKTKRPDYGDRAFKFQQLGLLHSKHMVCLEYSNLLNLLQGVVMTIFRAIHNKNYSTINNTICKDKRLSWKAKGIFLYAFSRPDNWTFHLNDIINQSQDGEKSVNAGLKELEKCGYLVRNQDREKGKFKKSEWNFYETPQLKTEEIKIIPPQPQKRRAEKGVAVKDALLSTESLPSNDSTNSAVVFSCLRDLKIPEKKKIEISDHKEEDVINAVKYCTSPTFKLNKKLEMALLWAINTKPWLNIPKPEISSQFKRWVGKINETLKQHGCSKQVSLCENSITFPRYHSEKSILIEKDYSELNNPERFNDIVSDVETYLSCFLQGFCID